MLDGTGGGEEKDKSLDRRNWSILLVVCMKKTEAKRRIPLYIMKQEISGQHASSVHYQCAGNRRELKSDQRTVSSSENHRDVFIIKAY